MHPTTYHHTFLFLEIIVSFRFVRYFFFALARTERSARSFFSLVAFTNATSISARVEGGQIPLWCDGIFGFSLLTLFAHTLFFVRFGLCCNGPSCTTQSWSRTRRNCTMLKHLFHKLKHYSFHPLWKPAKEHRRAVCYLKMILRKCLHCSCRCSRQ